MNVRIKRLLSMLVVMAMIATMIVPINFSTAKAEEAPASQTEIAKGNTVKEKSQEVKDIFAAATGDTVTAICPACYANGDTEEKTWTAIAKSATMTVGNHYYVAADITDSTSTGTYIFGAGCLNLNGKNITLTGGCRFLNVSAGGNTNIMDTAGTSVVKGSYDNETVTSNYATTLRVFNAGAVVNLFGGTFERIADTETEKDYPVPVVGIRTGAMNMYDGATIQNGDSTQSGGSGGNVYVNTGTTFNMYGGTIQGGKAASRGGNIYVLSTATLNVYGGEVLNGTGAYGGNIYVLDAGILNISGGFIAGGVGTDAKEPWGANVYVRNNQGTLSLTGGTIVGGVSGGNTANITLSGAPKVVSSAVHNGVSYTATRGLEKCTVDTTNLTEGADLWIGETMSQSYAYCPACGEIKSWTTFTDTTTLAAGNHYRLKENYNKSFDDDDTNNGFITVSCCFDLNGKELTVNAGRFADAGASETISVFDLAGGAVVKACNDSASQNGSVIRVNGSGAVVNLYGGTYKTMEDVLPEGVQNREVATSLIRVRQGELNMYDGVTVDGEGSFTDGYGGAIHVGHSDVATVGTFNMYGGVLKNGNTVNAAGTSSGYGGNLYVNISGIVNLSGGTIVGGNGRYGGNVYVEGGGALNMTGGTILGGTASESGSNIYVSASKGTAAITLGGGTVVGGIVIAAGTTVKLADDVQVSLSGSYDGQSYNETIGLELGGFEADVSELTNEARIVVTGTENDGAFTAAFDGAEALKDVFSVTNGYIVKLANNQFALVLPAASIDGTLYETAQEALEVYNIANGNMIALNGEVVIAEPIILDAANSTNLSLSGTGTVYGVDTSNDDFDGYQKITVTGDVVVAAEYVAANGNRYMALKEGESTYGFHRFETKLTHVTLRSTAAGLYYKASYQCDTLVRDRVLAYGVVLSTADMPGTDFLSDTANLYTIIEGQFADLYGDEVANTVKTTSGSVFGILKDTRDAALNTQYLTVDIYANSYIMVDTDGTGESAFFMADTTNSGMKRTDEGFDGVAWNLLEVVTAIDVDSLTVSQKTALVAFANKWFDYLDESGKSVWTEATSKILA